MNIKSERLKKMENELQDLKQWLKLGLVPKKDLEKHTQEIGALEQKIIDEKERLRYLKESGDNEEYAAPKKNQQGRQAYQEPHTMPGMDIESEGVTESGVDNDSESFDNDTQTIVEDDKEEQTVVEGSEEDDPFSDKNRWRRGILEDPDSDSW